MTRDTTFREFVEEKGIDFAALSYDSAEYKDLARQFNEAKAEVLRQNPSADDCGEEEEWQEGKR